MHVKSEGLRGVASVNGSSSSELEGEPGVKGTAHAGHRRIAALITHPITAPEREIVFSGGKVVDTGIEPDARAFHQPPFIAGAEVEQGVAGSAQFVTNGLHVRFG